MRKCLILFPIVGLLVAGCTLNSSDPAETHEIIRILEEEDIDSISTSHSQDIYITFKDGHHFKGTYVYQHAGKYSEDDDLFDILNLVVHIQKQRSTEEDLSWTIVCE